MIAIPIATLLLSITAFLTAFFSSDDHGGKQGTAANKIMFASSWTGFFSIVAIFTLLFRGC